MFAFKVKDDTSYKVLVHSYRGIVKLVVFSSLEKSFSEFDEFDLFGLVVVLFLYFKLCMILMFYILLKLIKTLF